MGHARSELELSNPRDPSMPAVKVSALAETGPIFLCIPERVAGRLALEEESRRLVTLADGSSREVPYVGPVRVAFAGRTCFVGALVFGDEVLLGAVPMEDMDLVVHPRLRTVQVNPASPDAPSTRM